MTTNTRHIQNPITRSKALVKKILPKKIKKKGKHRIRKSFRPRGTNLREFTGLNLVEWLIEQGRLKEASQLLSEC